MGASFTNVQVQVVGGAAATRKKVIAAIVDKARRDGLELLEGAEADGAERRVVVGGDERWIAVYDEATENQDQGALGELASALARATGGAAVSVLVHDSDAAYLELFGGGEAHDRWCSRPDWFGPVSKAEKAKWAGRPETWAKVLGVKAAAIAAAWRKRPVFAEEHVGNVGAVLGWPEGQARVGYHYLQDEIDEREDELVRLAFRDQGKQAAAVARQGAPVFEIAGMSPCHGDAVGAPVHLSLTVRNGGGAGRGLRVEVRGSAIDDGLIALDELQLVIGKERAATCGFERDARGLSAQLGDVAFPAGPSDWRELAGAGQRGYEAIFATQISAMVRGRALRKGDGELTMSIAPLEHPEGRVELGEIDVRVGGQRLMPRMPGMPKMTVADLVAATQARLGGARKPKPKAQTKARPAAKAKAKAEAKPTKARPAAEAKVKAKPTAKAKARPTAKAKAKPTAKAKARV